MRSMARLLILLLSIIVFPHLAAPVFAVEGVQLEDNAFGIQNPSSNSCGNCHPDNARQLSLSIHGHRDKSPGDHPKCLTCHPRYSHSHKPGHHRLFDYRICSNCHSNPSMMNRYQINPRAVGSYRRSYHGKAFLHFSKSNAATCVDCHGSHNVVSPQSKISPISNTNISRTCGRCHPGIKTNLYAASANHLQVEIDDSTLLKAESLFFRVLTIGIMLFLIMTVSLDLRKKIFCKNCKPRSGKPAAVLIAISFYSLVAGITMAALNIRFSRWAWISWAVSLLLAFIIYGIRARRVSKIKSSRYYSRLTIPQRLQHILLALSFTILVLTGMPLRFSDVSWTGYINILFGGFEGARIAHRVGAAVLIFTSIWHLIYLLLRWKKAGYSFSSWSMWPTKKDIKDLVDTFRLNAKPPQFDRFSFREKFDYFAVFWGLPIMILSGLVLAFPFSIGSHLPPAAFAAAMIAHSDEALLAMLAIVVWHFYNVHLDPDDFPANNSWLTGRLSESEMEREHPIEKAKIDAKNSKQGNSDLA